MTKRHDIRDTTIMAHDPYRYFRPEARNLLDQFAQGILELEKNGGSAGAVQRLLRLAHTLKGAARVVRQSAIAERAHAIEDALAPYRETTGDIARENIDLILSHLDEIGSQIVTLVPADGGGDPSGKVTDAAKKPAEAALVASDAARVVRADIAEMDAVIDGVAEAHARVNQLRRSTEAIEQIGHLADLLHADAMAPGGGRGRNQAAIAEELRRKIASLASEFVTGIAQADRELRQLRDAAEGLRLVAVDTVLMALQRTARDSARALGKDVTLESSGGDIRLDAEVLGVIQGALIQLVRNAVAHGIEAGGERIAAGKPGAGRITIRVSRRGQKVQFACTDDGSGIDLAAVRRAALERGLLRPDAGEAGADELVRVLLHGGVSTSAAVTDVSGRGVGLDVVREALERLGGEVAVRTEPGRGTTFELTVPRSVTSMQALLVEADAGAVALPLDAVSRILRLNAGDIGSAGTGASIIHDGKAIPFIPLAAALDATAWPAGRAWTALVLAGSGGVAAIGIERLAGTARVVVRPLPERLEANPVVAGAALDGEGNPQLVLDADALVAAALAAQRDGTRGIASSVREKRPVLVVDDSLTTRMLEKSILESAGYDVEVASSGEEGLELARRKRFALILCDVEMPGIDGFTVVERLRADPLLRDTPAILVTSRNAPADRKRGHDAGAHGYIVKSEFNQAELLSMIAPMVA
jgi:two-component system, chemotaxis family, sensor kinase CheA